MKNRYYKKAGLFVGLTEGVDVMCQPDTGDFNITSESLGEDWHDEQGYEEITRTEFMEAYLPISEKMNNKIGEL